jgi:hypothetical protein
MPPGPGRAGAIAQLRDLLLDLSDAGLDRGDSVHPQPSIGRAVRDLSQSLNGYQRTAAGRSVTFELHRFNHAADC